MDARRGNIIEIRNAFKRYTPQAVILKGLNMTVAKGSIYGLLGPSGCGKTTLLGCVAGYNRLDSGIINVSLFSKKQFGYMPQDIALMELFTVSEMFEYFGKINGMSSFEISQRGHYLLNLMELPATKFWSRPVGSMSGGQQRRISMTVALLHDPLLLIMDEPTVGLDPLISQKLWEYFVEITEKDGKTIIITTHYIEEARQAHMIGLMRNGVLLAEASPSSLLVKYNCETLEDVFLMLSQKQNTNQGQRTMTGMYPSKMNVPKPMDDGKLWDRKRMSAQIYKNTCWAKRNFPMLIFMMFLPAIMMYLFCNVYSDKLDGVEIAVVTQEVLPDSCLDPINRAMTIPPCSSRSRLSCRLIKLVEEYSYDMKEYKDFSSAYEALEDGDARALLYFSKNYSLALISRLSDTMHTPEKFINSSMVQVHIDMSEMTTGHKIKKDLGDSFEKLTRTIFNDCGYNPRAAEPPIRFEKPIFGDKSPKFTDTAMAGFMIPVVFFFTTFFSATSLGSEKISGFLERCLISGVRYTELMFAHGVVQVLMATGQNVLLFLIGYVIYDNPNKGSWALILTFTILAEIQGMFYGFIIGTLFKEERDVAYCSVGTVILLFLTCGMVWPLEGAHESLEGVLKVNPLVLAVEGYRSVSLRGWDLDHDDIIQAVASNTGFAVFMGLVFVWVCRSKQ